MGHGLPQTSPGYVGARAFWGRALCRTPWQLDGSTKVRARETLTYSQDAADAAAVYEIRHLQQYEA